MILRINQYVACTQSEGPGKRFAVWTQGCDIKCHGCFNSEMWDISGGEAINVNELFKLIKTEKEIEGVTFLGGEPFKQSKPLARLAHKIKKAGLSLVVFTGYLYENLKEDKSAQSLLKYVDILIDGPFVLDLKDYLRAYVGSSNQRYVFLTSRYKHLKDTIHSFKNHIEVRFKDDGCIIFSGMGDMENFAKIKE